MEEELHLAEPKEEISPEDLKIFESIIGDETSIP